MIENWIFEFNNLIRSKGKMKFLVFIGHRIKYIYGIKWDNVV